ncbi:ATP-binding protein [Treponema endosymbiont of Eucomonympha sp.]|uniref:ATP-binding protein n=1 Tax=Treponema endosymbiont of Eucomonympha sp. TaxID=1580831 RepID=UPI00075108C9|nr:ATP-binding protein [Treponema endosymbiont of Eucomonympha sp.]
MVTGKIRPRDRDAVIQSLRAGVVPRAAQYLIQVGRKLEIEAMLQDIERVADGGGAVRFVIGEYGAGKTFFLNLSRAIALEKGVVTASADLTPDKRLHATGGYARALYRELMRNLSTRTKPDGGAVQGVVEKFLAAAKAEARETGAGVAAAIQSRLQPLTELVNGYDFAAVLGAYCEGAEKGNDALQADAVRWLRGEFSTKTDAHAALGVRAIVDDSNYYDQLKLFARFVRLAGYAGFIVCLDEMVNIYKLQNKQARNSNYEQILRIVNDALQGNAVGLGFVFGGTPEFQLDTRRGMFSYDALRRRLGENSFARRQGLVDFSGPVIRLSNLTREDFYLLLEKIRLVYAYGVEEDALIPREALAAFMEHCAKQLGNEYFRTPGTTIIGFINLLAVLEQNPGADWRTLLGGVTVRRDTDGAFDAAPDEDAASSSVGLTLIADSDDDLVTFARKQSVLESCT